MDPPPSSAAAHVTDYSSRPLPVNQILRQLPAKDREALLAHSEYINLPVGYTIARVEDPFSTVYFPESGVVSVVSEMTTGHHLAVATVGAEGVLGVGTLFGKDGYPLSLIVLVESAGYRVASPHLRDLFHSSRASAQVFLGYIGSRMWDALTAAACNRVHSHRQRLARWLLTATDKAARDWLPVTHQTLAQMVGGPRHAVTVALNDLRARGAIAHLRGRIEVLDRAVLTAQACECYVAPKRTGLY
jgi:CRP-like cAMP-binding protein